MVESYAASVNMLSNRAVEDTLTLKCFIAIDLSWSRRSRY